MNQNPYENHKNLKNIENINKTPENSTVSVTDVAGLVDEGGVRVASDPVGDLSVTTALSTDVGTVAGDVETKTALAEKKSAEQAATASTVKKGSVLSRIYLEQLLCLILIGGVAYWSAGPRIIVMALFSILGAVVMDMVGCTLTKKTYNPRDLSTLTAGLCIALLTPAGISYMVVLFGASLTIAIKHVFGGKDNYIFNPTATAFAFLLLCYPGQMLLFSRPLEQLPIWGEIDPTVLVRLTPLDNVSSFEILMGNIAGATGAVHILVLLVAGACLLFRKSISGTVTITALLATLLFAGTLGSFHGTLTTLVSGSFLFVLLFLLNDPQTLPKSFLGKVYYGLIFACGVALFRHYGRVEGYPVFALIIVNTMSERSDVLATQSLIMLRRASIRAKNRLNSYERIQEKAVSEINAPLLSTTYRANAISNPLTLESTTGISNTNPNLNSIMGEIFDGKINYNMPPLDNEIIKINRRKLGLIAQLIEKFSTLAESQSSANSDDEIEVSEIKTHFLENLRAGIRDLEKVFSGGGRGKNRQNLDESQASESGEKTTESSDGSENDKPKELTPLELSLLIDDNDVIEVEDSSAIETKTSRKKKRGKKAEKLKVAESQSAESANSENPENPENPEKSDNSKQSGGVDNNGKNRKQ
ncbi:MAG: RnfABCDGE type electron transport complex subunit D [Oscillospiraceae bacterium]|nr:RnfABCDGE type electron transport complex subunit D [Oscillospiraceae bacterium]